MDPHLAKARFNMIHQQVRPWGVLDDRALGALEEVPRERFVPDAYVGLAYADCEPPLGNGQVMLPPKVVGRLLQALAVQPGDRALEIGTGSGYVSACLAHLGARVLSLEIDPDLAAAAQARLAAQGFGQVQVRCADALAGRVEGGPFDVIAVTGSLPDPSALTGLQQQLTLGGRLFAVIGEAPAMHAVLVTRESATDYRREPLFETCVEALTNAAVPARFAF
jgi:protein-L-isoaspartate(D-aspartate) O-methyltransferase